MYEIEKPCKIPLPNIICWNSWFKMVFLPKIILAIGQLFFIKNMREIKIMNQFQQLTKFCKMCKKKEHLGCC
jgi:hypothetical protein